MSTEAPIPVVGIEMDSHDRLLDVLQKIVNNNTIEVESKPLPLGKALQSELKYHRLQKEQNENSPSSTARTTPVPSTPQASERSTSIKRKRPRRNPVWNYFEIMDNIAYCQRCPYSTRSVFSTNLKVHLKSHHPEMYRNVIAAEYQLNSLAQSSVTTSNDSGILMTHLINFKEFKLIIGKVKNDSIAQRHPLVGSLLSNYKPVVSISDISKDHHQRRENQLIEIYFLFFLTFS